MRTILIPAYGRKYSCEKEAVLDYLSGRDFKIDGGPYCSCRDFVGVEVSIRFKPGLYASVVNPGA